MHKIWVKIFSQLLEVLVSVTVRHELNGGKFSVIEERQRMNQQAPAIHPPLNEEYTSVPVYEGITEGVSNSTHVFHFNKSDDSI